MTYHRDRNNPWVQYSLIGAGIALVLVVMFLTPIPHRVNTLMHRIGSGLWSSRSFADSQLEQTSNLLTQSKSHIIERNQKLEEEVRFYKLQAWESLVIRRERDALYEQLGYVADTGNTHTARVISYPPHSRYDTIIIDQGQSDGVEVGQHVYAGGAVIIGRIVDTTKQTAVVELLSTSGVETTVRIIEADIVGESVGHGGGSMIVELPQALEIKEGYHVLHVATGDIIGVVGEVDSDEREPFQSVYVRNPLNVQHIEWVYIK